MQILIYGCTRLTDALAPVLLQDGHKVTVVDTDADRLSLLERQTHVSTVRVTEPLMQDFLQQGGITNSGAFFSPLGERSQKLALNPDCNTHI